MSKLDDLQKKLDVKTWLPDYKFNKWIFRGALLLIVVLAVVSWALLGFGNPAKMYVYVSCPEDVLGYCQNPFYDLCNSQGDLYLISNDICEGMPPDFYEFEVLQGGESIGEKPHWFSQASLVFAFIILILAFVVNHLVYNKNYSRRVKK